MMSAVVQTLVNMSLILEVPTYEPKFNSLSEIESMITSDPCMYPNIANVDILKHYKESWQKDQRQYVEYNELLETLVTKESLNVKKEGQVITINIPASVSLNEDVDKEDIRQYLKLISIFKFEYEEHIVNFINDVWKICLRNKYYPWEYSDDSHMPKLGDWIYGNEYKKCGCYSLRPILKEWKDGFNGKRQYYNFSIIFKLLGLFHRYGVNNIPVIIMLCQDLNELTRMYHFVEERLTEIISEINSSIKLQNMIDEGEDIYDILNETLGFEILGDRLSKECMKSMNIAIKQTPGAIEWLINDGNIFSDSSMLRKITSHPEVDRLGHTGNSMSWTLAQFKDIYTNGWDEWCLAIILSKGVGWDKINFDKAFDMKNEECSIYHLKKKSEWDDISKKSLVEVVDDIIERDWSGLGKEIIDMFGSRFTLDQYVKWTYKCDDELKNGVRHIFSKGWNTHYPRKVYYGDVNLHELIRRLWVKLAEKEGKDTSRLPSNDEIDKQINKSGLAYLNGVFMCGLCTKGNEDDAYFFDYKLKKVGELQRIVDELRKSNERGWLKYLL